ncbi:hypothetical protein M9H77_14270 [Catharanthus roseus]|uniref:Uncharacterized protein n=1 Tax=Catharanthus roseus TaxID=4058 RepID=A0ACC0BMK7_CATRO|nr:hypothetical protein M9H77_14270 [Catharanthus roseus]
MHTSEGEEEAAMYLFFINTMHRTSLLDGLNGLLTDRSFTSDAANVVFDLMLLRTYLHCSIKWGHCPSLSRKDYKWGHLSDIKNALSRAADHRSRHELSRFSVEVSRLPEIIQRCKPIIRQDCLNFLDSSYRFDFDTEKLSLFVTAIDASLCALLDWNLADVLIGDVKAQIVSLKENMNFFNEVFEFALKCCKHEDIFEEFKIHLQELAWRTACLLLLYWVQLDVKEENMAPRMDVMILSDLLEKSSPLNPDVTRMYITVLVSKPPPVELRFDMGKLAHMFVEFLSENLQVDDLKNDGIQMLFVELIFFFTFLMDRQKVEELARGRLILTQVDALVDEVVPLISSLSSGGTEEDISGKRNFLLHNFLEKANAIKIQVRKICAPLFQDQQCFNFPACFNVSTRIDSLLENLKDSCNLQFSKHLITMLREELFSLKELNLEEFSILELQNEHKEIKDLWIRIVKMGYNAERAANSFKYMNFLWHDILYFSDVVEEVKLIKGEMKRINDQHVYDIEALNFGMSPNGTLLPLQAHIPLHAHIPSVDKLVGFKDEMKEIMDQLIGGSDELDIVSIVGMPGSGKTTLAKKVYGSIQHHFHRCAWCTVSQTFNSKRMFMDILKGVGSSGDSNENEGDLAQRAYQSLKGQKYLIVLDDIWDVRAWNALHLSFPDDNKGSRIIFTSRIHDLISKAKSGCVPFPLKLLPEKESWELLEKNIFDQDYSCPTNIFVDIGMQIAKKCKGLTLAVLLIAGLLKKDIENLDWWRQVGERLDKLVAIEDCKGFIPKHETKSLEFVAEEYLMDLVGRSLVTAIKRSSTGRIKTCIVHDLLREFCFAKGEAEKVFKVFNGNEDSNKYLHYRMCIQDNCWSSFLHHENGSPAPFVHSLLPFPKDDHEPAERQTITELTLLKCLIIACNLKSVPAASINKLQNLETLVLENCLHFYAESEFQLMAKVEAFMYKRSVYSYWLLQ